MNYISTKDLAKKWNISPTRVVVMAKNGQIEGAKLIGKSWAFPENTEKPIDGRYKIAPKVNEQPFHFPLYASTNYSDNELSYEEIKLRNAEKLLYKLDFQDAYDEYLKIFNATTNPSIKVACYATLSELSMLLGKYHDALSYYNRLAIYLAKGLPYKKELMLIYYESTINNINNSSDVTINIIDYTDCHPSCAPMIVLLKAYNDLLLHLNHTKPFNYEVILFLLLIYNEKDYPFINIFLNIYLGLAYSIDKNIEKKNKHILKALEVSFKNELYYPIALYSMYYVQTLKENENLFPKGIIEKMLNASEAYNTGVKEVKHISSASNIPLLTNDDYKYLGYLIKGTKSSEIAKIEGLTEQTICNRYKALKEIFGAKSKKDLLEKYKDYVMEW